MTTGMDRILFGVLFTLLTVNNALGQRRGQYGAGVTQATEFDCPEEFGYYPHPSDCTQYYVCVFGGALLESCTGGLMYSHELQTCDWPRNVGCGADNSADSVTPTPSRTAPPRIPVPQQSQRSSGALSRDEHERQQRIHQEEIAKQQLYADDLGPAEEIESDRQQRVYRGQPASLGQVARDRDGLRHQPATNTLQAPSTSRDKVSVISYATQPPPQYSGVDSLFTKDFDVTFDQSDHNFLNSETYKRRKKRQAPLRRQEPSSSHLLPSFPTDNHNPNYELLFDPNSPSTSPPIGFSFGPESWPSVNLSAFLNPRVATREKPRPFGGPPNNEDLRPPPVTLVEGNADIHPHLTPYRTLPSDGDDSLVSISNSKLNTPLSTKTHMHFQRFENHTKPFPVPGFHLANSSLQSSPSSHVHEISTQMSPQIATQLPKLEAETSQSYINERGERLHGNFRDSVAPPGKTPLPPIPWVDERRKKSEIFSQPTEAPVDEISKDKPTTEAPTSAIPDEPKLEHIPEANEEEDGAGHFGPHSAKLSKKPKYFDKETESHIVISDVKYATDSPSQDDHDKDSVENTGSENNEDQPEAENSDNESENQTLESEESSEGNDYPSDENDDYQNGKYEKNQEPDVDYDTTKDPHSHNNSDKKPKAYSSELEQFDYKTPVEVEENLSGDEEEESATDHERYEEEPRNYSHDIQAPKEFFSDFGKEFEDFKNPFSHPDFDFDRYISDIGAESGIDSKVAQLAKSTEKEEQIRDANLDRNVKGIEKDREPNQGQEDRRVEVSTPKTPSSSYIDIPFSWETENNKNNLSGKGKEVGSYYDRYLNLKSPFSSESHRDMRYFKDGARINSEKSKKPKRPYNNPFADPNFDFDSYFDSLGPATSAPSKVTNAPVKDATNLVTARSSVDNMEQAASLRNEHERSDGPLRSVRVKLSKDHSRTPLATNHKYENDESNATSSANLERTRRTTTPVYTTRAGVNSRPRDDLPERHTTPYSTTVHSSAYHSYPRHGPYPNEFLFQQVTPTLFNPPAVGIESSGTHLHNTGVLKNTTPRTEVEDSSFSVYGPQSLQTKFRKELHDLHETFRKPVFGINVHRSSTPTSLLRSATNIRKPPRKTNHKNHNDMNEYFDVLGYKDEFSVENIHLAPTESYDDLNPLKDIYPELKPHVGFPTTPHPVLNDHKQYQVFETSESRQENKTTRAPSQILFVPVTDRTPSTSSRPQSQSTKSYFRPNNRGLPESFRPSENPQPDTHPNQSKAKPRPTSSTKVPVTSQAPSVGGTRAPGGATQVRQRNRPPISSTVRPKTTASTDSSSSEYKETALTTPTTPSRRPHGVRTASGYRPEPSAIPQPQSSPTTGRSVLAPANSSYHPNNYDQYYAVYDDDADLYRDVDYSQFQNNHGNAPQPFSRGNNNIRQEHQPQNVEIITQQQQRQPNNGYLSATYNVRTQDVYSPTVSSQDYNDNYNSQVNVQFDQDDTFPQTKASRGSRIQPKQKLPISPEPSSYSNAASDGLKSNRHPNGLKRQTDQGSRPQTNSAQDYFNPSSPFPFPDFNQPDRFVPSFSPFPSGQQSGKAKLEPEILSGSKLNSRPYTVANIFPVSNTTPQSRGTNREQPSFFLRPPQTNSNRPFAFPEKGFILPSSFRPFSSLAFPPVQGGNNLNASEPKTAAPSAPLRVFSSPAPARAIQVSTNKNLGEESELLQPPAEVRILPKPPTTAPTSPQTTTLPSQQGLRIVAKTPTNSQSEVRILPKSQPGPSSLRPQTTLKDEFSKYNYYDTTSTRNEASRTSFPNTSSRWVPLEFFAGFFEQPRPRPKEARPAVVGSGSSSTVSPNQPSNSTPKINLANPVSPKIFPNRNIPFPNVQSSTLLPKLEQPVRFAEEAPQQIRLGPSTAPSLIRFPNAQDSAPPTRLVPPTQTRFAGFNNNPAPSYATIEEGQIYNTQQQQPRRPSPSPISDVSSSRESLLLQRPLQPTRIQNDLPLSFVPRLSGETSLNNVVNKGSISTEKPLTALEYLTIQQLPKKTDIGPKPKIIAGTAAIETISPPLKQPQNITASRAFSHYNSTLASPPDYYYDYEYEDYIDEPYDFVPESTPKPNSALTNATRESTIARPVTPTKLGSAADIRGPKTMKVISEEADVELHSLRSPLPVKPQNYLPQAISTTPQPVSNLRISNFKEDSPARPTQVSRNPDYPITNTGNIRGSPSLSASDERKQDALSHRRPIIQHSTESPNHSTQRPTIRVTSKDLEQRRTEDSVESVRPVRIEDSERNRPTPAAKSTESTTESYKLSTRTVQPNNEFIHPRTYRPVALNGKKRIIVRYRPRTTATTANSTENESLTSRPLQSRRILRPTVPKTLSESINVESESVSVPLLDDAKSPSRTPQRRPRPQAEDVSSEEEDKRPQTARPFSRTRPGPSGPAQISTEIFGSSRLQNTDESEEAATAKLRSRTTAPPRTEAPEHSYPSTTYHPKSRSQLSRNLTRVEPQPTTYSPRLPFKFSAAVLGSTTPSSTSHENEVSPSEENASEPSSKGSISRSQGIPLFRATVENAADYLVTNSTQSNPVSKLDQENNQSPDAKQPVLRLRPTTASPDSLSTPGISRGNARGRGKATYTTASGSEIGNRGTPSSIARGSRPTLKPSTAIVSKAQEFVDIYRYPPSRPEPVYPTPQVDKSAAKCRKDVCLLPDCNCGGKDIPGNSEPEDVPQLVLLTFDDAVNDLNKGLYHDLFDKGRTNPNGCPIAATFYVSHEWTDYSQVQNLYADGHEMASHSVSHSFGEQFSQKKWTKEIAGQREILAAYGGVKLDDVRGMRAPFLAVGGNKMFKMLYDSNFTYDSSMPVYENKPPSWPYTLDYKLFHDCMIPPCPTRSYPGVWEVPMVMWTDLNGGRCSMGDACSNPPTADGVYKMLIKNFERHYTTNRAPFGLFYHAAWFTQPHHKEGFIAFLDTLVSMNDVWLVTNWQAIQWVRDPTPLSRINNFQPFQCNYQDRPRRCNNPKVCNLWHKSGVRYMRTCQPCPDVYPWTGKSGVRNSRVDNDLGNE